MLDLGKLMQNLNVKIRWLTDMATFDDSKACKTVYGFTFGCKYLR
ncbi:MAG: hypothetical protein ACK521_01975 [bacterium]